MLERTYKRLSSAEFLRKTRLRAVLGRYLRNTFGIHKEQTPAEILISDSLHFVYVCIPKVATRSIIASLASGSHSDCAVQSIWLSSLLNDLPEVASYFKFAFVRNPWARALSVYGDKIVDQDKQFTVESFTGLRRGMPFPEFVEWLSVSREGRDEHADRHWLSQHRFIASERRLLVDYVGRYEDLPKSFHYATEVIRMPNLTLAVKNSKIGSGVLDRDPTYYRKYYNPSTRRLIGERYAIDIELFDYSF